MGMIIIINNYINTGSRLSRIFINIPFDLSELLIETGIYTINYIPQRPQNINISTDNIYISTIQEIKKGQVKVVNNETCNGGKKDAATVLTNIIAPLFHLTNSTPRTLAKKTAS